MTQFTQFDRLLRRIAALREAHAQLAPALALHTAHEFNPFEFVRSDELGLSQIIRWLFDARGSHGQGGLFLRQYLENVAGEPIFKGMDCSEATAVCEVLTTHADHAGRRIDILVEVGDCCLAIENKPWAEWQENQLEAYFADIQQRNKYKECRILALKGWVGSSPDELITNIPAGKLIDTDYATLATILRDTIPKCKAEPIRRFLEKFVDYLDHLFGGKSMSVFSDEIARQIIGDSELSASAFDLIESRYDLFDELARKLDKDLMRLLNGTNLEQVERLADAGTGVRYPSLALRGEKGAVFRVTFYRGLEGGFWGLKEADNNTLLSIRDHIVSDERVNAPGLREGDGWIWWEPLSSDRLFQTNALVWKAMNDGSLAKAIFERAVSSISRADQIGG